MRYKLLTRRTPVSEKSKWLQRLKRDAAIKQYDEYNDTLSTALEEHYPGNVLMTTFRSGNECRDLVVEVCGFDKKAELLVWPKYRAFFDSLLTGEAPNALPPSLTCHPLAVQERFPHVLHRLDAECTEEANWQSVFICPRTAQNQAGVAGDAPKKGSSTKRRAKARSKQAEGGVNRGPAPDAKRKEVRKTIRDRLTNKDYGRLADTDIDFLKVASVEAWSETEAVS